MTHHLGVAERAAREAGALLKERCGAVDVRAKGDRDFVTEADLASQALIERQLKTAYPDHVVLGEEGRHDDQGAEYANLRKAPFVWMVDPLDGTTNYIHGFPFFCVSIALVKNELGQMPQVVAGVVFDPIHDECFTAAAGQGAWLNGEPIHVASTSRLEDALVAVSLANVIDVESLEVRRLLRVVQHVRAFRRSGSTALNLCYVAAARLSAYWATTVQPWDAAAGALLVSEAGGKVVGLNGSPFDPYRPQFVAGATEALAEELRRVLAEER